MSSTVKENEILTVNPEGGARSAGVAVPGDVANRQQPVALEVPVAVNGARTVEGSDKREPFSESTKTVLVFGNGAVIRLSSAVSPGQLLFLTNEKTKKEVVCQVVKSKNYRNVSGYVELEFTEPVVGFWGMRFPGDRVGSQSASAPVTTPPASIAPPAISVSAPKIASAEPKPPATVVHKPVAPVPATPVASVVAETVPPVTPKPVSPVNVVPAKPPSPSASVTDLPSGSGLKPVTSPPKPSVLATPVATLPRAPEVRQPEASVAAPPPAAKPEQPAAAKDNSSEALKLEAARLQAQLSSLLFTEPPKPAQVVAPVAAPPKTEATETTAKIFELAKSEPAPLPSPIQAVPPVKSTPAATRSPLESEEVKIPAWLEPLARNVAAPASTEELIEREKSKHTAALAAVTNPAEEPAPLAESVASEETPSEVAVPTFGSTLAIDETPIEEQARAGGSNKLVLFGAIAAGILVVAAAGTWYVRQGSSSTQVTGSTQATVAHAARPPAAPAAVPANSLQPSLQPTGAAGGASHVSNAISSPKAAISAPAANSQPSAPVRETRDNSASAPAAAVLNAPPVEQPKKPSLGQVRLAKPTVKHKASEGAAGDAAPAMSVDNSQIAANSDALGAGLVAANSKQPEAPAAPLAVGGDVRPAKMISSVPPAYPSLAKNQHISGDVKIDALIDVNGRVTTMKAVSGPTLLHQSAMDALRQWKYQPATLDGKPVPMHLTITIQFRLQ
jgi:TonB family protein